MTSDEVFGRYTVTCSLDLDKDGDGRWKIEWYPVPCNVGSGNFSYYFDGQPGRSWYANTS